MKIKVFCAAKGHVKSGFRRWLGLRGFAGWAATELYLYFSIQRLIWAVSHQTEKQFSKREANIFIIIYYY